jgi:4-hydroxy-L-threonine phosphate dehydrogenase PdxA
MKPLIGLMLGDCTGIGPEQCARVLADKRLEHAAKLLVVGDARVLAQGASDAGVSLAIRSYQWKIEALSDVRELTRLLHH